MVPDTVQRVAPLFGLTCAAVALSVYLYRRNRRIPPPGPPSRPLLGIDLELLPNLEPWKTYAAMWAQLYGHVLSFHVLGRRVVILNSFEAATELLNKRSSVYSDRPLRYMYDVIMGCGTSVFNIPASDPRHRIYRKLLHASLNVRTIQAYEYMQEEEARALVRRLANDGDNFLHHVKRNATDVIMRITYGYRVQDNDPFVDIIEESFRISSLGATPGKWLVDQFPILRFLPTWFPGAKFKRQGREWCRQLDAMSSAPLEWTKKQAADTADESFAATYLSDPSVDEFNVQKCATGLYAGGADTVASAMTSFILAMSISRDVQVRARHAVDSVTSHERLPTIRDIEHMPYLKDVMREVLRWAPVAPLALPHCLTQDDQYMSYHLPKGATVFANVWAMMHDPSVFHAPEDFDPGRFAPRVGAQPLPDPLEWVFGFGKRICPGLHFAQASLLLNMACVLSVFDVDVPIGPDGNKLEPQVAFTTGITSHPMPFPCSLTLRPGAEKFL